MIIRFVIIIQMCFIPSRTVRIHVHLLQSITSHISLMKCAEYNKPHFTTAQGTSHPRMLSGFPGCTASEKLRQSDLTEISQYYQRHPVLELRYVVDYFFRRILNKNTVTVRRRHVIPIKFNAGTGLYRSSKAYAAPR